MDVMVVGRRAEERWTLAAALTQPAGNALGPDAALARLAHPAAAPPDVVLLVVRDEQDLAWCAAQTRRSLRRELPVVAVVVRPTLVAAARAAGATSAVVLPDPTDPDVPALQDHLVDAVSPAIVLDLATVGRSA